MFYAPIKRVHSIGQFSKVGQLLLQAREQVGHHALDDLVSLLLMFGRLGVVALQFSKTMRMMHTEILAVGDLYHNFF